MKGIRIIMALLLSAGISTAVRAEAYSDGQPLQWGLSLGANIGATSPIPLPSQVKQIYQYRPHLNYMVGLWTSYRLGAHTHWAISSGLELERKSFKAVTELNALPIILGREDNGNLIKGNFVGDQSTTIDNHYLSLPLMVSYLFGGGKVRLHMGGYASLLLAKQFVVKLDGDGLKDGRPFAPGSIVRLDFNDQIRPYDLGLRIGADYYLAKSWAISLKLSYGLTPATKASFSVLERNLHNIYGFIGVSYRL